MKRSAFNSLVAKLTRRAKKNPKYLDRRLFLMAILSYGYFFGLLLATGGLTVFLSWRLFVPGMFWFELVGTTFCGFLCYTLLAACQPRTYNPEGLRLQPELLRRIRADLKAMREKVGGPKVDRITFDLDYNASVVQLPKLFGMFFSRNYLRIGLPLIFSVSREEFQAVLAHEFAHLSRNHSAGSRLAHSTRTRWLALNERIGRNRRWYSLAFVPFCLWIFPRLNAVALVRSRQNEFEADRLGAQATTPEAMASALCKIAATSGFLDKEFDEREKTELFYHNEPQRGFIKAIVKDVRRQDVTRRAHYHLRRQLRLRTRNTDTHPSLSDRLEALNQTPPELASISIAAEHYFGADADSVMDELDRFWYSSVSASWRRRHTEIRNRERKSHVFRDRIQKQKGLPTDYWTLATFTEEVFGPREALKYYQQLLERYPELDLARLRFAQAKYRLDDFSCLHDLYRVMQGDPLLYHDACLLAYETLLQMNDPAGAETVSNYLDHFYDHGEETCEERQKLGPIHKLQVPELSEPYWDSIIRLCERNKTLKRAVILQKKTVHAPQVPMYVVAVTPKARQKVAQEMERDATRYEIWLPGSVFLVSEDDSGSVYSRSRSLKNPFEYVLDQKD